MAPRRKRRPGGGRKPAGTIHGKTEAFSTRITAETRRALLREKRRTGRSISQIAEQLIVLGLESRRERERDEPMRALAFLIDQLSINISETRGHKEDARWRTDPFLFRALQEAIYQLMNRLVPDGDPLKKPPELKRGPLSTPQALAARAVDVIWHLFSAAEPEIMDTTEPFSAMPERMRAAGNALASQFVKSRSNLRGNQQRAG
jgi:hypothetical protein